MNKRTLIITTSIVATATVIMLSLQSHADRRDAVKRAVIGPDVVCWYNGASGGLDMETYGNSGGVYSYAFGTTSCNWGDMEATWGSNGNESYPVIAQNCYRLANGRFEQIGTSWLKHSFCAVSEPGCGSCQGTPCSTLGIGCADTYWAGLNADTTAPRSEINAFTGEYSYPFSISPSGTSALRGKLLLAQDDISDANNPGALYFIEGQYICSDEAAYSNQWNNCSWRQVDFSSITNPTAINQTQVADPAIFAWKEQDNDVDLQMVQIPNEGQLHVGARAYDNGDGTWDYEYAVHNMNSHRSVRSFAIGENLVCSTDSYDDNEWANAIRWGSVYNFRFTANSEPEIGQVTLELFRPGFPDSVNIDTVVPSGSTITNMGFHDADYHSGEVIDTTDWTWQTAPPVIIIDYPNGQPELIDPTGGTTVDITIASGSADPVSGSGMLHWLVNGGNGSAPLNELGNNNYQAVFSAFDCEATVNWYISIDTSDGSTITSPTGAPNSTWSGLVLSGYEETFGDDFQTDQGWSVDAIAGTGNWVRAVPSTGGVRCDAPSDADGSGMCYVTGNSTDEDVDDGTTTLTSPAMDASSSPMLSYYRWYNAGSTCANYPVNDTFTVEFSTDDGQTWMNLETVGPGDSEASGGWYFTEFDLGTVTGFVPSDQFRVRFLASDLGDGSIVEAGVDGLLLGGGYCDDEVACPSDVTGDGVVNVTDLLVLIAAWGPCNDCDADIDGNGIVDVSDVLTVIAAWGPCQ